jgi:NhaP-type Na+/H+ or K+/H+ antiporter
MLTLAILAAAFALYGLVAARLDRWSITAPMVFVAIGIVMGSGGVQVTDVELGTHVVTLVAELTLGVLLFADASTVRLRAVGGDVGIPVRLLALGLPLTMAAGTIVAFLLFPEGGWASAALIAAILAPTDAALGLGIFTNRAVPPRVRRALNVESGLNDGFVTPFVTLFLAIVLAEEGLGPADWVVEATVDIAIAVALAAAVGIAGGALLRGANERGWTSPTSSALAVVALAVLGYSGAVAIGGNGFVAAFLAGLVFGRVADKAIEEAIEFTERIGLFSSFIVWWIFGALFAGPVLEGELNWRAVLYAAISLTLIRMVPVAIGLAGTRFKPATLAFMGWFGPRGLASVVFTLIAVEALHEQGLVAPELFEIATWTVLLSVLAHGLSARPLAARYGSWIRAKEGAPELLAHPEPRRTRSVI